MKLFSGTETKEIFKEKTLRIPDDIPVRLIHERSPQLQEIIL